MVLGCKIRCARRTRENRRLFPIAERATKDRLDQNYDDKRQKKKQEKIKKANLIIRINDETGEQNISIDLLAGIA